MKRKIPPWLLIGGAVVIGIGFYLYKKKKEQAEAEKAATEGEGEKPYVAGVENPVEEYPYSVAGGFGGGAAAAGTQELGGEIRELFTEQRAERKEERGEFAKSLKEITEGLGAINKPAASATQSAGGGGGPPSESKKGATVAPTTPGDRCGAGTHSGFPLGTPPDCYRISRSTSAGSHKCQCHGHQNGNLECQHWNGHACVW